MFDKAKMKPFESGDIFLGLDEHNNEIGVRTDRHALTVAGARSGKGACAIIPNLLRWPHNVLVIDPKGENTAKTWEARQAMGSKVYVLDPFENDTVPAELRASFNPLLGLDPDSLTGSADLEVIADGLVKRSDPKHAQWDDGAVTLLSGIMAYVIAVGEDDAKTLKSVRDILLLDRDELYAEAQDMKACEAFDGIAQEAGAIIMAAFDNEKGMESDFVTAAQRHIKWINHKGMRNVLEKSTFSLSELKNGKASVFVVLPPEYLETRAAFLRLFVRLAISAMAKGGSDRGEKCLFILDEFNSLGKMDVVSKSAGLMPSYGVHLWPILQDLGQLVGTYGQDESQTFFGNSDLHQFFGNTDKPTLEYMSHMTGIISVDEVGAAPDAPMITGGGQSLIAAASAHSKDSTTRGMGAAWGAMSGGLSQLAAAAQTADHQNKMAAYQQKMATVGRARLTPDEMAKLVQCKSDVVADNMFCITHGSDRFVVKPAPYFRKVETPVEAGSPQPLPWWKFNTDQWIMDKIRGVETAPLPPPVKTFFWVVGSILVLGFLGTL
jgi:type IV secretory pathway TraG/TraD family ATPase VirD4